MQTFKWHDYLSWQKKVNEAKASAVALKASLDEVSDERKKHVSKWKALCCRSRLEEVKVVKTNIYDKGFVQNFVEIFIPLSTRRSFYKSKSKSG